MPDPEGASLCDWIPSSFRLSKTITRPEHLANPFCNILNSTGKTATEFPDLLGKKRCFWRLANSVAGAATIWFRSWLYWPKALKLTLPDRHVDVVIISHLTNIDHLKAEDDFYFGDLHRTLEQNGLLTHTLLINHARAGRQISPGKQRIILPAFLSPFRESGILARLIAASFTLSEGDNRSDRHFHRLARLAQFGNKAIGDYRIGMMLTKLIRHLSPKVIIHTYEGHGWERIVAEAAHAMPFPAKVFGYQHAVIFPGPKAILQNRGKAMPDHIYTTGQAAKSVLIQDSDLPESHFSILGSSKAVKVDPSVKFSPDGACLIAPEGTLGEVILMAGIGLDAARANPDQQFILRLHPVLPHQKVAAALAPYSPLPDNFELSQVSLDEDLARCSWLCYRGSTLAYQGILAGLRPIYLDPDGSASTNDPLPQDLAFRRCCVYGREINDIILKDRNVRDLDQTELMQAIDYAKSYLMPFQPDALMEKIKTL